MHLWLIVAFILGWVCGKGRKEKSGGNGKYFRR